MKHHSDPQALSPRCNSLLHSYHCFPSNLRFLILDLQILRGLQLVASMPWWLIIITRLVVGCCNCDVILTYFSRPVLGMTSSWTMPFSLRRSTCLCKYMYHWCFFICHYFLMYFCCWTLSCCLFIKLQAAHFNFTEKTYLHSNTLVVCCLSNIKVCFWQVWWVG